MGFLFRPACRFPSLYHGSFRNEVGRKALYHAGVVTVSVCCCRSSYIIVIAHWFCLLPIPHPNRKVFATINSGLQIQLRARTAYTLRMTDLSSAEYSPRHSDEGNEENKENEENGPTNLLF